MFRKEENRIYMENEEGNVIAEVLFPETEPGVFTVTRTFVDESLRGKGVAGKLVAEAAEAIREKGGQMRATCSYAVKWLEKNPV